ncbi:MAG TPA: LysM domain-containing protein [Chloroflexi bacterium]|nr:LysM domain-containing protein [Chloroflexota bacterium]
MAKGKQGTYKTMSRDPFADMELEWTGRKEDKLPPVPGREETGSAGEETVSEPYAGLRAAEEVAPVGELKGKGVWLLYSRNVELAIEMAIAIGATHILYKTGDRGMFFVEAARRVYDRVRQAGLVPFAWTFIYCDDPIAEAEVAIKSARVGYQGIVLDIEDQAGGKTVGAAALGRRILEAGLEPGRLYYTSFPNIWQHLDIPYQEMNTFCRGGFMPQCYPTFRRTPRTVIKKWAYGEHARWSREWGNMPSLYPILAAYRDEHAARRLNAQEFLEWAQALAAHSPSFFSVYRAGTTDRELWPILAALGEVPPTSVPQPPPAEPEPALPPAEPLPLKPKVEPPAAPPPVYHVVTVNDTIWSLCKRHGITRAQFWEWNGHLWDERGLPRDPVYMQEGWRVRVG